METHETALWPVDGRPDVRQVFCTYCGKVGTPQLPADAQAIADRHEEIGGCEPLHG